MTTKPPRDQASSAEVFAFFTEIGIISQLSTALLAKTLPDDVHPSHFAIVNHLFRVGNGWPPVRIAAAMQVTKTTMSHSIKVLEGRGLIELRPDPDDGRAKQMFLTDKGRAFREKAIAQVVETFGHVLESEHRALMARVLGDLETLRRHLDANR